MNQRAKLLLTTLVIFVLSVGIGLNASSISNAAYGLIKSAGSALTQRPTLNFVSGTTCVDNAGSNQTDCTSAAAGGYATIDQAGTPLTQRTILNFIGAGVTCVDNSGATRTDCTIPSSGGTIAGGVIGYSAPAVTLPAAGTTYIPPVGGGLPSTTEANVQVLAPVASPISNMSVVMSAAIGLGNTISFTYRDTASSQTVTCTISGATAKTCSDLTHSFTPVALDPLDIMIVTTGNVVVAPNINITTQYGAAAGGSSTGMLASFFTTNSETTSSTTPVDLTTPDTITFTLAATTNVVINYMAYNTLTSVPNGLVNQLNIDGTATTASLFECDSSNANIKFMCGLGYKVSLGSGSHTIKVQHYGGGGTTGSWTNRLTQAFSSP
jgi:hypothetical protein